MRPRPGPAMNRRTVLVLAGAGLAGGTGAGAGRDLDHPTPEPPGVGDADRTRLVDVTPGDGGSLQDRGLSARVAVVRARSTPAHPPVLAVRIANRRPWPKRVTRPACVAVGDGSPVPDLRLVALSPPPDDVDPDGHERVRHDGRAGCWRWRGAAVASCPPRRATLLPFGSVLAYFGLVAPPAGFCPEPGTYRVAIDVSSLGTVASWSFTLRLEAVAP